MHKSEGKINKEEFWRDTEYCGRGLGRRRHAAESRKAGALWFGFVCVGLSEFSNSISGTIQTRSLQNDLR